MLHNIDTITMVSMISVVQNALNKTIAMVVLEAKKENSGVFTEEEEEEEMTEMMIKVVLL